MKKYIVKEEESNQTLEKYIKKLFPNMPLSFLYKLFRKKDIKVNGHWEDKKYIVNKNEEVTIYINDEQIASFNEKKEIKPSDEIKDLIVYEDENVLIVNKPRGMLVQPDSINSKSLDRLVISYLMFKGEYQNDIEQGYKPGPAHRLDRNTSGLVIFGKNTITLQYLSEALKNHEQMTKHYYALVVGNIDEDGIIDTPLLKDEKSGKVYVSDLKSGGKSAKTMYHVLQQFDGYTLLDVVLLSGRMHQIRVHMASINHPVVGDNKYGNFKINHEFEDKYHFSNQFLHAYELDFHKVDGPLKNLRDEIIEIPLNKEYLDILKNI